MASKRPARSRSSLSDRQWSDLRQAARLARSEGVTLEWRRDGSIIISPHIPSAKAGIRQTQRQEVRAAPDSQLEDTQRCELCRFVCSMRNLSSLSGDGMQADLTTLLSSEAVDGSSLVRSLTQRTKAALSADDLTAQNGFLGMVALWLLHNSTVLKTADLGTLSYSGLLPLVREVLASGI